MLNHEWCKSRQDHGIKNHKKDSRLLTIIQPNLPNRLCRQCISKSTVHYKHNHGVKKFIESHLILIWLHFYKSFTNCLAYLIILITFSFSRLCVCTLHSLTGCGLAWPNRKWPCWEWPEWALHRYAWPDECGPVEHGVLKMSRKSGKSFKSW